MSTDVEITPGSYEPSTTGGWPTGAYRNDMRICPYDCCRAPMEHPFGKNRFKVPCPTCDRRGSLPFPGPYASSKEAAAVETCQTCNGDGWIWKEL